MFANIWTALEPLVFLALIPLALIWIMAPYLIPLLIIVLLLKLIFRKGR